ncbi:MAG: hypothetical protein HY706_12415 [Candidatus Hydrogenedentes bacterium]|nr:hypothetical protein [Candidatus Hydrogenedentota bacterium]
MREYGKKLGTWTGPDGCEYDLYELSEDEMYQELRIMRERALQVGGESTFDWDVFGYKFNPGGANPGWAVAAWDSYFFDQNGVSSPGRPRAYKFRGRIYNYGEINQYFFGQLGYDAGVPNWLIEVGLWVWKIPNYGLQGPSDNDVDMVYSGYHDASLDDSGIRQPIETKRYVEENAGGFTSGVRLARDIASGLVDAAIDIGGTAVDVISDYGSEAIQTAGGVISWGLSEIGSLFE